MQEQGNAPRRVRELAQRFVGNFAQFVGDVTPAVRLAGQRAS
jgi:hypothetical protein